MLYSDDIRACNEYAQGSPENLHRAALFVLATIQQQLEQTPVIVTDFIELGDQSRFAWGGKQKGVTWLSSEACINKLYGDAIRWHSDPATLLEVFLRVPGFALVKAGFMCQIFAGHVGCIDLHNVKLYNVSRADTRYDPAKPDTLARKRERYVALCDGLGGAVSLWSRWCDYVAEIRPKNWVNGAEVSKFHVDVITGKEDGGITDLFSDIEYEPRFRGDA